MKDKRQFIVWGLGRFGSSVAETLTALGHEVLGIDNNEDVVENMADKLTHAVVCDVIDEKTVNSLGIRNFDVGIVAIGTLEPSLLATMLLREAGLKTIVAKASNALHGKMLEKLGATKIIYPERDMGRRVGHNLAYTNILDFVELSDNICLMEVNLTRKVVGKSLAELDVQARRWRHGHHRPRAACDLHYGARRRRRDPQRHRDVPGHLFRCLRHPAPERGKLGA